MKKGWKETVLSLAADPVMGQSPPSSSYNDTGDGLPFLQGKADFGALYPTPSKWCTMPLRKAKHHDILMSVRAPVGNVNMSPGDCCIGRGLAVLSCKFNTNPFFLFFFLLSNKGEIESQSTGTTFQSINKKVLEQLAIPLPPLPEQKKIAAVLLKIQQAIEIQEKIIQSLHDLKKSTMKHLFTHGLRGEKTKMTEIGEIPWSWRESKLGSLCKSNNGCIQTGPFGSQLHVSDYQLLGVPVVNPTHMFENRIIHDRIPYVSEANANRLSRHILETGDILFARRGEIGRHALVAEYESAWLCGTGCFLIRIRDSRVSAAFISWLLYSKSSQDWLKAHAAGAIMPNLNNKILQTCPVTFPKTRTEQSEIVNCLVGLVQKLDFHEAKKSAFQDLFKATLNKLMTGAISTKDLHINTAEVSV